MTRAGGPRFLPQSRAGSMVSSAISHLRFCLPACVPGALQTNVTEKETWTGESPQCHGCKGWGQEVSSGRKRSSKRGNTSKCFPVSGWELLANWSGHQQIRGCDNGKGSDHRIIE